MKEIVVISGKGGTGKTSITAALSTLAADKAVIADCDVDAADMHLLLQPKSEHIEDFYSGFLPEINQDKCIGCGRCQEVCVFNAIEKEDKIFSINDLNCEGCGYCSQICPRSAITMVEQNVGQWFISKTRIGSTLVHARLKIGAENSGKLVAKVKKETRNQAEKEGKSILLIDGSPGIGCPVVSSLSGADFVVLVTEATTSGLHDLIRVHELTEQFHLPTGCIINKADLNINMTNKIKDYLKTKNITLMAELPYDEEFSKAMTAGKTIMETNSNEIKNKLKECWKIIESK